MIGAEHVDVPLDDGQSFGVAGVTLRALATPGHTDGCMSYVLHGEGMVFTGNTLLIRESAQRPAGEWITAGIAEVPREKPVVALCRSGRRSALAVNSLREAGFDRVASLSLGLLELTRA